MKTLAVDETEMVEAPEDSAMQGPLEAVVGGSVVHDPSAASGCQAMPGTEVVAKAVDSVEGSETEYSVRAVSAGAAKAGPLAVTDFLEPPAVDSDAAGDYFVRLMADSRSAVVRAVGWAFVPVVSTDVFGWAAKVARYQLAAKASPELSAVDLVVVADCFVRSKVVDSRRVVSRPAAVRAGWAVVPVLMDPFD